MSENDYWSDLRLLLKKYECVKPWERPQDFWDKLELFCKKSKDFTSKNPIGKNAPSNPNKGTKRGITEWDVYHALSYKRLKKEGVHL